MSEIQTTVINDLGIRLTLTATSASEALNLIRQYAAQGYAPEREERPGGIELPLEAHDNFDWRLLGARPWKDAEGNEGVWHKGFFYRKRELEAVDNRKMKLPAAIKYSRGARPTDPPHIQEKSEGDIAYVTLVIFRRGGLVRPEYQKPEGGLPAERATPRPPAARAQVQS